MFMHFWSIEQNLAVARGIGHIMYLLDAKHRKRARHNLARAMPELSDRQLKQMTLESMQGLLCLGVETMFTPRLVRLDTFKKVVEIGDLKATVDLLLSDHKGVMMLTGHYGNWEVLGFALAMLGFETVSVARPLDNPYLSDFVFGIREKHGQKIVAKKGATPEITQTLENHGVVGFVADQNAGPKGMFVDFFGRQASTYKSIGLLAMQFEVPIVIGYARRVGKKFRFKIGTQDLIKPEDWKSQDDPLRYITQRYTSAIEALVREEPGQYLWLHRRWKTRPKGELPEKYD